jgi:hypothetical protein
MTHPFFKLPPPKTWYEQIARDRDMVIAGPSRVVERFSNSLIISFNEPVSGFTLSNLHLTVNGGANLLTGSQTLTTTDNTTWTLGNLTALTTDGGNDQLTLINTNIAGQGDIAIGFGGGNDVLAMANVKAENVAVSLGGGNDVASFVNITAAAGGFALDAGSGRDVVVLNRVRSGASGSGGGIAVEMGPGSHDVLTVVVCSADMAAFADTSGTGGVLVWKHTGNHFGSEVDAGFQIVV